MSTFTIQQSSESSVLDRGPHRIHDDDNIPLEHLLVVECSVPDTDNLVLRQTKVLGYVSSHLSHAALLFCAYVVNAPNLALQAYIMVP
jgi:hypothetical protein